jgi:dGTPase
MILEIRLLDIQEKKPLANIFPETDNNLKNQLTEKQWQDLIDFEGNANGFSVLTSSRPGIEGGLRISYATLGAFMKYPKESLPKKPTKKLPIKNMVSFNQDKAFFKEVAEELGLISK